MMDNLDVFRFAYFHTCIFIMAFCYCYFCFFCPGVFISNFQVCFSVNFMGFFSILLHNFHIYIHARFQSLYLIPFNLGVAFYLL